jgi:hypothetical protein
MQACLRHVSSLAELEGRGNPISLRLTPYDKKHYLDLIRTRGETIRRVVAELKPEMMLANALDAGCGVGFFAQALQECGLYVRGFDGRLENVENAESASRPAILSEVQDIRTRPWGYPGREIVQFLASAGYRWFALNGDGDLQPVSSDLPAYDAESGSVAAGSARRNSARWPRGRRAKLRERSTRSDVRHSRGSELFALGALWARVLQDANLFACAGAGIISVHEKRVASKYAAAV